MNSKTQLNSRQNYFIYIIYTAAYICGVLSAKAGIDFLAAAFLILAALVLYILNYRKTKNLVDLRGLFTLSWVGGEGIACLKLSRLQSDWENMTWLCFFLIYICFNLAYDFVLIRSEGKSEGAPKHGVEKSAVQAARLLHCIAALGIVSAACFTLEAVVVGYIPLFNSAPHAYSYFHISGVHYFTISCILIPALTVLYTKVAPQISRKSLVLLAAGNVLAAAIPVLCVSRFQLLFAVGFAAVTYLMLYKRITWKMIVGLVVVMVPVYVLLTVARRHDVEYLNGIFEMKNTATPIFITQPYIYVANNFENFNCMVQQLTGHTYGIRMLFPVFALTGLKFVFPGLTTSPLYITKTELTTLTMFYDSYYDFGIAGVIGLSLVVGIAAAVILGAVKKSKNPVVYLFYGQTAIYLGLSFFTTWFSNPTTWFWYGLTVLMYWYLGFHGGRKKK